MVVQSKVGSNVFMLDIHDEKHNLCNDRRHGNALSYSGRLISGVRMGCHCQWKIAMTVLLSEEVLSSEN
jgi:hypothetical protein